MVQDALNDYVNNTICDIITEQPQTFKSCEKLLRTENTGIPALRNQTKLCTADKESRRIK